MTSYPPDAGLYCSAWDEDRYRPDCAGNESVHPPWCASRWCFVDPCNCAKADKARFRDAKIQYCGRMVYVSYSTCEQDLPQSTRMIEHKDFAQSCQLQVVEKDCLQGIRNNSCIWTGRSCIEISLQEVCKANDPVYG